MRRNPLAFACVCVVAVAVLAFSTQAALRRDAPQLRSHAYRMEGGVVQGVVSDVPNALVVTVVDFDDDNAELPVSVSHFQGDHIHQAPADLPPEALVRPEGKP